MALSLVGDPESINATDHKNRGLQVGCQTANANTTDKLNKQ